MPRNKSLLKAGATTGTSKKIVIKPFQKPPSLPPNYYESVVQGLLQGTLSVLDNKKNDVGKCMSLQHAYTTVVHLVSHQYGPRLYADLRASMQQAAELVLLSASANATTTSTLQYVQTQYQIYTEYLLLCKHVFLPLDRTYHWSTDHAIATKTTSGGAAASNRLQTIWQVGLDVFGQRLKTLGLDSKLYQEWLAAFLLEWNSTSSSGNSNEYLQAIWYLWQDLGWLGSLSLQEDLEQYWRRRGEEWKSDDVSDYKPAEFLQFAYDKVCRVALWQPWLPSQWLLSILEQCLIAPHFHADYLLKAANLDPILQQELFQPRTVVNTSASAGAVTSSPTQQLWMLASRLPMGQQQVAAAICVFAKAQGLLCIQRPNNVQEILTLQSALGSLIASLPHGSEMISLKSTWENVVNVDATPCMAESLAKFLDQLLRSTKKMDAQAQNTAWLQRIIDGLFIPIQAKDVFEAFYRKDLAKRLLWNRVVSMDVEKQVCSLLKAECGAGYTSKMEGMFQDVDWSRETMMVYKQSVGTTPEVDSSGVEMEVQVLTTGYWPVYPQYPGLHLPESLLIPQERFANHYKTKYQGRRMTWQYALGHCVVRTNGFSKPYELIVSLCQALVLTHFDTDSKLTLPSLMTSVGLEDRDEMERLLLSLSLGKEGTRILRKIDFDKAEKKKTRPTVDDKDEFVINKSFDSNQRRIRINNIMMKETKEEREKTVETVSRDRLYLIDAVLVRIMKARKSVVHQSLIAQVLEQVKVPAQVSDVKQRIESLIEREYIERDAKNRNRYNYLA